MAKIESGKISLNQTTFDFQRLLDDLTSAEIQVAELIRNHKRTKEIAELLNVSESTVVFHRSNIRKKLNIVGKDVNLAGYLRRLEEAS